MEFISYQMTGRNTILPGSFVGGCGRSKLADGIALVLRGQIQNVIMAKVHYGWKSIYGRTYFRWNTPNEFISYL